MSNRGSCKERTTEIPKVTDHKPVTNDFLLTAIALKIEITLIYLYIPEKKKAKTVLIMYENIGAISMYSNGTLI